MGRVTGVHGLKGYLKVTSFAESASIFAPGERIRADRPDGVRTWLDIVKVTTRKKGLLVLFNDLDVDGAQAFVGAELQVERDSLPELEDDTYYWHDLIGMDVIDTKRGRLGTLKSVIRTGSNDVFVVSGGEREVLVPAISHVVLSIDVETNEMRIDLPEGL